MKRVLLGAISFCWLSAAAAWADIPLPKNLKYVQPRMRFEGVDKHQDHVFYLRYLTFTGGPAGTPYSLTKVKDAKPFTLTCQRRLINMSLLAMERTEFDKKAKDDPSLKWLTDKTEGVKSARFNPPATVGDVNKEVPVTSYRVSISEGKLSVTQPKDARTSAAPAAGLLPPWAFGMMLTLSLAGLGLWFVRRR